MKVYVGNLPFDVESEKLKELFSSYGEIEEAVVISDKFSGRYSQALNDVPLTLKLTSFLDLADSASTSLGIFFTLSKGCFGTENLRTKATIASSRTNNPIRVPIMMPMI